MRLRQTSQPLIVRPPGNLDLEELLDNLPTVSRDQVLAVLTFLSQTLKKLGQAR